MKSVHEKAVALFNDYQKLSLRPKVTIAAIAVCALSLCAVTIRSGRGVNLVAAMGGVYLGDQGVRYLRQVRKKKGNDPKL